MHNTPEYSWVCDCIALYASVAVSKTLGFGYNHMRVAGW